MSLARLAQFGITAAAPSGGGPVSGEFTGIATDIGTTTTATNALLQGPGITVGPFDLEVKAVRIWTQAGTSGGTTETVDIWRISDTTKLASANVTRVNGEWAESALDSPVTLDKGTAYAITAYASGASREITTEDLADLSTIAYTVNNARVNPTDAGFPTTTSTSDVFRGITDVRFDAPGAKGDADAYGTVIARAAGDVNTFNGFRYGWRFTVGAADLLCTHVRTYLPNTGVNRIIVYRDSDAAVMVTQDVTGVADAWAEEAVTPFTLAAGVTYTISGYIVSGGTGRYRTPLGLASSADLTVNAQLRGSSTVRPTTSDSNGWQFFVDLGYSL